VKTRDTERAGVRWIVLLLGWPGEGGGQTTGLTNISAGASLPVLVGFTLASLLTCLLVSSMRIVYDGSLLMQMILLDDETSKQLRVIYHYYYYWSSKLNCVNWYKGMLASKGC